LPIQVVNDKGRYRLQIHRDVQRLGPVTGKTYGLPGEAFCSCAIVLNHSSRDSGVMYVLSSKEIAPSPELRGIRRLEVTPRRGQDQLSSRRRCYLLLRLSRQAMTSSSPRTASSTGTTGYTSNTRMGASSKTCEWRLDRRTPSTIPYNACLPHPIYGALQVKVPASLVLLVPLYVATCG